MPDPTTTPADVGGLVPEPLARPGRFGPFGGRYVPETLIPALDALDAAYEEARQDPVFMGRLEAELRDYVGRPSALSDAPRLSAEVGAPVYNFYVPDPSLKERAAAEARAALGDAAFEELREQGRAATFEEAVRLGSGAPDDPVWAP